MTTNNNALLDAVSAVFVWVSYADGVVCPLERARFLNLIQQTNFPQSIKAVVKEMTFQDFEDSFTRDFQDGVDLAKHKIEVFKGNPEATKKIIEFARIALTANKKLKESEEAVLQKIAGILGVDEATV